MLEIAAAKLLSTAALRGTGKVREWYRKYARQTKYSAQIGELATELYKSLECELHKKAEKEGDERLQEIVDNWDDIAKSLDEEFEDIDLFFEDEDDAVEKTAEVIAELYTDTEDSAPELVEHLKDAISDGYRDALRKFQDKVQGTVLEEDLQDEFRISVVDKLNEAIRRLGSKHYGIFDSEQDLEEAKEEVFGQGGIEARLSFVERPEIEEADDTEKLLLTGRKGTGKTRVLARLVEEFSSDVDDIVVPRRSFQSSDDISVLESERFDGDVLLVWDDIHGISEESNVFREAVLKLEETVEESGHRLKVLATSRSEENESLPEISRWEEDRVWADFEKLELLPLEEGEEEVEILRKILDRAIKGYGVSVEEEKVKEDLLIKAYENDPSPFYIVSVVKNTDEELTHERVSEMPEEAVEIWEENYSNLGSPEKKVLQIIKLLSDIRLSYHSLLVEEIYERALEKEGFTEASETLVTEHWIVNPDIEKGAPEDELFYRVHDICVEAVDDLSELEVEDISNYLLENEVRVPQNTEKDKLYTSLHNNFTILLRDFERLRGEAENTIRKL